MASVSSNQIPLMNASSGRSREGCAFHNRCLHATKRCGKEVPGLRQVSNQQMACHYAEQFLEALNRQRPHRGPQPLNA
ncbi:hypothetical protein GEV39_04325 [Pseudomonas sp. NY5710]|nr:hypothetical protein GEV39_04325 [Pseudomonas sp. NY5710]